MNIGIKDVLSRINVFFILYLALLAACLIIKALYTREQIYFAVNARYNEGADLFFRYVTNAGDGWTTIILSALLALVFSYRKGFLLITSYAITSITAQLLKHWFDAPRPIVYFSKYTRPIHYVKDVYVYSLHSFPSGHSVTAFSTAVLLTYLCRRKAWGVLFLAIAVLTGYSRMYLSEHFFEDVVAGSVIGVMGTVLWISWLDSRRFLQSEKWNKAVLR